MDSVIVHQLVAAGILIASTSLVHAIFVVIIRPFLWVPDERAGFGDEIVGVVKLVLVALWLIAAHTVSASFWAVAYLRTGVSEDFPSALYFALSTYTTLGFGDILAPKEWELLTGFAALNGLLLFGLSAAVLVDAAVRLRQPRR